MFVVEFATRMGRILPAFLLFAVAACSSGPRADLTYNPPGFGAPDAPKAPSVSEAYRLGPLDTIVVTVFQVPDLSGEHQIDPTGMITMPIIGDIAAQGLTPRELADVLRKKYEGRYLHAPEVQVAVKEAVSERITVEGSVKSPGVFPITGASSLLQAVALARGVDDKAKPRRKTSGRRIRPVGDPRRDAAGSQAVRQ